MIFSIQRGREFALIGDLMIFEVKEKDGSMRPVGGIYLGNSHVLVAHEKGLKVFPFAVIAPQPDTRKVHYVHQ